MSQQYTNELTPEMSASLSMPPFSAEQKAAMPDGTRELLEVQKAFLRDHQATAIYRIAVDGSLTARDGVVRAAWNGGEIELVDSLLSNGDQIISTPQATGMLVERDGVPMGASFLAEGV